MTKKLIVLGLAVALVIPVAVGAAVFKSGSNVTLDQSINGNVYAAGGAVRQIAGVNGDLLMAGGNLFLSGSTTKDVMAVGGQVDVVGPVGEDLRVAGGNLTLNAPVKGDVVMAGGSVSILPGAPIGGDLSVAAGQVTIDSKVNGSATIRAGKITIGEKAVIVGKLIYYSGAEIVVPAGAQLLGGVEYHQVAHPVGNGAKAAIFGFAAVTWIFFKLLMLFLVAWILSKILGVAAPNLVTVTAANFWKRVAWGFVTLVVAPILAVILLITVVGIPFGVAVFLLYFFLLVLAYIFTVIFTGSWLFKWFKKSAMYETNWKTAAIGAIALTILAWIPIIGWIAGLVLFLASFGAVGSLLHGWFRVARS